LMLVEIFYPKSRRSAVLDSPPPPPIATTVSHNYSVSPIQTSINSYFITAVKLWQLITNNGNGNGRGDRIEKEVRSILVSMKSLQLESWPVFQRFLIDFCLYTGQFSQMDIVAIENPLKLACVLCSMKNYKVSHN